MADKDINTLVKENTGGVDYNTGLYDWAGTNGGTGDSLNDRLFSLLASEGYTTGSLNDRLHAFLVAQGYTGSLTDMWYNFWLDGGTIGGTPAPVLVLVSDDLDGTPPTYSFTSTQSGTLYWDFDSSATPPAQGAGDIDSGSSAITAGSNSVELDFSLLDNVTGYLHFRVVNVNGTSNILTSQEITTPVIGAFTPASLFGASDEGVYFNPAVTTSLWTDDGVTQASVGDAIYRMDDLSGNGHHAYQTDAAKRPILRSSGGLYWLEFDSTVDAQMATEAYTITGPDQTAMVGHMFTANAPGYVFARANPLEGTLTLQHPITDAILSMRFSTLYNASGGYSIAAARTIDTAYLSTCIAESGVARYMRVDGTQTDFDAIGALGTPATGEMTLAAISPGGIITFPGNIYGLLHIDRKLSAADLAAAETYMGALAGVTI